MQTLFVVIILSLAYAYASIIPNGRFDLGVLPQDDKMQSSSISRISRILNYRGGGYGVKKVSSLNSFDEEIENAGDKLVIVDFTAVWCGPCRMIGPVFDAMAATHTSAVFLKVDVDELPDIAQRYKVMSMPTFLFLKNGKVVDRFSGASAEKLQETIDSLI